MDLNRVIDEFSRNKDIFTNILSGLEKNVYTWKSNPEKWCLLEIICHLHDEEREDFRSRTRHILENRAGEFPRIDPASWVSERNYINQDYSAMLGKFIMEREASLEWLKSLDNPDWLKSYTHPKFGEMTGGMFLANWLAHDYLHIRQILKVKYDYLQPTSREDLSYAGNW